MTNFNADRETLRALADEGNEKALDRLADLADQRGDLEEMSELLDEGCKRAGQLLTARAVTKGDLLELQRISGRRVRRSRPRTRPAPRRSLRLAPRRSPESPTSFSKAAMATLIPIRRSS